MGLRNMGWKLLGYRDKICNFVSWSHLNGDSWLLGMGIRGLRDEILDPWMGDGVCFYCLIVWNLILRYVGFGCIMR